MTRFALISVLILSASAFAGPATKPASQPTQPAEPKIKVGMALWAAERNAGVKAVRNGAGYRITVGDKFYDISVDSGKIITSVQAKEIPKPKPKPTDDEINEFKSHVVGTKIADAAQKMFDMGMAVEPSPKLISSDSGTEKYFVNCFQDSHGQFCVYFFNADEKTKVIAGFNVQSEGIRHAPAEMKGRD